jgi:hypothetical protein
MHQSRHQCAWLGVQCVAGEMVRIAHQVPKSRNVAFVRQLGGFCSDRISKPPHKDQIRSRHSRQIADGIQPFQHIPLCQQGDFLTHRDRFVAVKERLASGLADEFQGLIQALLIENLPFLGLPGGFVCGGTFLFTDGVLRLNSGGEIREPTVLGIKPPCGGQEIDG